MKSFFMLISPFLVTLLMFAFLFKYLRDDDPQVAKRLTYTDSKPSVQKDEVYIPKEESYSRKRTRDVVPDFARYDSTSASASGGFKSEGFFRGGRDVRGLSIHSIRWSRHSGYERLVFDISDDQSRYLSSIGRYSIGTEYESSTSITGELSGCNKILGISPNFAGSNIVYKLDLSPDTTDGCSFTVALKRSSNYKVFVLPDPARLIIDFRL